MTPAKGPEKRITPMNELSFLQTWWYCLIDFEKYFARVILKSNKIEYLIYVDRLRNDDIRKDLKL